MGSAFVSNNNGQIMPHVDTSKSIIAAAESLFAEQGFAETTVRQITNKAGANLAAINYHFGSKKGLVQAVAERFLSPLCDAVESALAERVNGSQYAISLEEVLEILMRSLLAVNKENQNALAVFMKLLDLAYMSNQQELRDHMSLRYGDRFGELVKLLKADAAPMEDDEFFWRLHFMLGSITFTLSNYQTISAIERQELDTTEAGVEEVLHRMIPVIAAGMQARADKTLFCRI